MVRFAVYSHKRGRERKDLGGNREIQGDQGVCPGCALDGNSAPQLAQKLLDHGQPQTKGFAPDGVKGLKELGLMLRGDPGAVVEEDQFNPSLGVGLETAHDLDFPTGFHGDEGVDHEIADDELKNIRVVKDIIDAIKRKVSVPHV